MLDQVRTCYPGRIVSFDKDAQTATVQLAMERVFSNLESYYNKTERETIDDVPVYFLGTDEYSITHNVVEGDNCLIWFAHRGYDHWLYKGKYEAGLDARGFPMHQLSRVNDMSDAFVTTGFRPIPSAIPDFQTGAMEIRNHSRDQRVSLFKGGSINIHNPSSDVTVDCDNFIVNASSSVQLKTPSVTTTGTVYGDKTAGFADVVTAPNFIVGVGSALRSVGAAASDLVDMIKRYTGHTHNYTDDGATKVTQIQNDA